MSDLNITIADLETLAHQIETEDTTERQRLHRLIRAYARILFIRQADAFERRALEFSDEDGHSDNSYPPEQKYKDHRGPKLIKIVSSEWEEIATSTGYYYDWRAATSDTGCFVAPDGALIGRESEGVGHFGQFAAHPGDCDVRIEFDYRELRINLVPMDRLVAAEAKMRELAFPHVAKLRNN